MSSLVASFRALTMQAQRLYPVGFMAVRGFSSDVVSAVDNRYASSLAKVAANDPAIGKDIEDMEKTLSSSPKLMSTLADPTVDKVTKSALLAEIAKASGFKPITSNFLRTIADNGRASELETILFAYKAKIGGQLVSTHAIVTTTIPMSPWQTALLVKKLRHKFFKGNPSVDLKVTNKIDPKILGGLTVQLGDKFIDLSVKKEIQDVQALLTTAIE
mmetsp:Transcript_16016/g.28052  ORF Transcript_16016/g.28052 Transcript_16016/m.28052 type:complete len:216 (+) Transcript_16016:161-808(+)